MEVVVVVEIQFVVDDDKIEGIVELEVIVKIVVESVVEHCECTSKIDIVIYLVSQKFYTLKPPFVTGSRL